MSDKCIRIYICAQIQRFPPGKKNTPLGQLYPEAYFLFTTMGFVPKADSFVFHPAVSDRDTWNDAMHATQSIYG